MKTLITALLLCIGSTAMASEGDLNLDLKTQMEVIEQMLNSDVANNEYLGEASFSEIIEARLSQQIAGIIPDGESVTLSCKKVSDGLMNCMLNLFSMDEYGESSVFLKADVRNSELSTILNVSNVQALLAG